MLESFILDGTVTLVALGVLALELVVMIFLSLSARDHPAAGMIANAVSGFFLILALRAALVQAGATAVALFLTLAFVAHLVDAVRRLRCRVP
jgi:hypothetical protein